MIKIRIKTLCTLIALYTISSSAQTNIATYKLSLIEEEHYDEVWAVAEEDAQTNNFYLIFDKDYSLFTSDNTILGRTGMSNAFSNTISEIIFDNLQKTYYTEKIIYKIREIYCIKRQDLVEWQITDEKKEINGIECYRALGILKSYDKVGDYRIDAWFAPSIPYSYGPGYFNGLPGLIMMAMDSNRYFFSLSEIHFNVEVDKRSRPIPERICKKNVITYKEYITKLSEI